MEKIKFREYSTSLPLDTKPLHRGCICTKKALEILDYCDEHGLNRKRATYIDKEGHLHLKPNCDNFKETQAEQLRGELSLKMFSDPTVYDDPETLKNIKEEILRVTKKEYDTTNREMWVIVKR